MPKPVGIWPENRLSVEVFLSMRTQWRTGMNGPTGFDYGLPLSRVLRHLRVPADRRDEVFSDLQLMESAALSAIYES